MRQAAPAAGSARCPCNEHIILQALDQNHRWRAQAARKALLAEVDCAELHRRLTNLDVLGAVGGADELARRAAHELHACPPQALLRSARMHLDWCGQPLL